MASLQPPDRFSFISIPVRSEHISPTLVAVFMPENYLFGMHLRREKLSRVRTEIDSMIAGAASGGKVLDGQTQAEGHERSADDNAVIADKEKVAVSLKRQFLVRSLSLAGNVFS
jgi:hypothetical protein